MGAIRAHAQQRNRRLVAKDAPTSICVTFADELIFAAMVALIAAYRFLAH
jgi:hypothetical protein